MSFVQFWFYSILIAIAIYAFAALGVFLLSIIAELDDRFERWLKNL